MVSRNNPQTHNMIRRIGTVAMLAALAVGVAAVQAQDELVVQAEPLAAEQPLQNTPVSEPPASQPASDNDEPAISILAGQSIQSLSFNRDTSIARALQTLAQTYRKNIIPSARITGNVTVNHLYDVTFEEALQGILAGHNYRYDIDGNFINVYTREEYEQMKADMRRMEYAMIVLYYINADEAQRLAEPLLSDFGRIGVTSPAGKDTEAGRGGDSLAIHDRLTVSDYPENVEKIREMLSEVDVEPMQVLIEVTVMKAVLHEDFDFGVDWSTVVGTLPGASIVDPGIDLPAWNHRSGLLLADGLFTAGISIDDVTAAINATESVSDTILLANPKILALNKQAGMLHIGKEEGFPVMRSVTDGGTSTSEVEKLVSGTVLKFRPFIGRNGMIRMEIHPEQSDGRIVSNLPVKETTQITTNVMVNDGQTIVLGGLFQEETTLTRNQVPLLGDIPFIGEAFKRTRDNSVRTELIVLITPHIIHSPEEADGADRIKDVYRMAYNARKGLHGLNRARLAEERYSRAVREYNAGNYEAALMELNDPYEISPRNNLDAIRLRERIFRATHSGMWDTLEHVMLQSLEKEESGKWLRR